MKFSNSALHDLVASKLDNAGQVYTQKRRTLVEALSDAGPCTLPELLLHGEGIAQSSAYRNLTVLEEMGVVRRLVHHGEYGRWELAEELTGHHHHHLVCHSCDVVIDVELPSHIENLMDEEFEKAASGSKFTVDRHNIDIVGTCADCQETAQV
ncbi:MAG: transcriptional repressor [Actinomycetota bacterium]|nr:transcriptional repressor [Actinomycetota bacterium]